MKNMPIDDYGFLEHCLINEEFSAVEPGIAMGKSCPATFGSELLLSFTPVKCRSRHSLPRLVAGKAIMGTAIAGTTGRRL